MKKKQHYQVEAESTMKQEMRRKLDILQCSFGELVIMNELMSVNEVNEDILP